MELDKIEKLAELKEKGMISEEEYAAAKARILNSATTQVQRSSASDIDSRTYSMLLHFSQLFSFVVPIFGWIVPVVLWGIRRNDPYIDQQGKVVFNWIISSFIYFVICLILTFIIIGAFMLVGLAIISVIFIVMGAVRAKDGVTKDYPLSISFFSVVPVTTEND